MDAGGAEGTDSEVDLADLAAALGVPDFVYWPSYDHRGNARREVGDLLLMSQQRGAVLQLKTRASESVATDDADSARQWAVRKVKRAESQARGSRRTLSRAYNDDRDLSFISLRSLEAPESRVSDFSRSVTSDPGDWPLVVVLDNPKLAPCELLVENDTFVVTADDFRGLMQSLRSVEGFLAYVQRAREVRELGFKVGAEEERFLALCAADAATDDGGDTWMPWLSTALLDDPAAADAFDHLVNRSWPVGEPLFTNGAPDDYLKVIQFLDEVPPTARAAVGRTVLRYTDQTRNGGQASGITIMADRSIFLFVLHVSDHLDPDYAQARLGLSAEVRAWEIEQRFGPRPLLGFGVFSHPRATDYVQALVSPGLADNPPGEDICEMVWEDLGGPLSLPPGYGPQ